VERIGILGGTFSPPHAGHLALARHARTELGLGQVLLMPANRAPSKPSVGDDPGPEHRLRMCRLAVADEPGLMVSALEIERGGTSYTVDTVQAIHDVHPDAELTLILGADTARTLPGWREPQRLLGMVARLGVAERDELDLEQTRARLAPLMAVSAPGSASRPRLTALGMAPMAVSSSAVRRRIAAGEPIAGLVGERVAGYIAEQGLYRTAGASAPAGGGGA
jgi:nicotinate-nucleotide adenylyltransferase